MTNTTDSAEVLARKFIQGILSDNYQSTNLQADLAAVGIYAPGLRGLIKAYESGGVDVAKIVLDNLVSNDQKFKDLLESQEEAEADQPAAIPELPEEARLAPVQLESVCTWLAEYVKFSTKYSPEGYKDYHLACGLWVLSTVAARRVRIPLAKPTFTALAIALVGRTSLFAKSVTADAGVQVLNAAGLGWLLGDDETTPQALMAEMAGYVPPNYAKLEPDEQATMAKRLAMSGQLGWYYDEMNQLIDSMTRANSPMADFAGLLRKLDNFKETHSYNTRSNGRAIIKKPYLAFCGSTTPANLARHATKGGEFWGDGFWARFAFITPPKNAVLTDTMGMGEERPPDHLVKQLQAWNDRLGVPECTITEIMSDNGKPTGEHTVDRKPLQHTDCTITPDAYQAYKTYRESLRALIVKNRNQDLDGNYARLADKAIRIAGLIASLEHKGKIDLQVWSLAQQIAEMFRTNLHELYAQINSPEEENPVEDALITFIKKHKQCTARDVKQFGSLELRRMPTDAIRGLLASLVKDGLVEILKEGRKESYKLVREVS